MNQSQFLAITCNSPEAREKSRVHVAICFGFASHWLKNWRDSFKPITKRSNRNHVITFDSHLKTALKKTDQTQFNKFNPTRSTITYLQNLHFWQSNWMDHIPQATGNQLLLPCQNSSQVWKKKRQQKSFHNFNHYTWGEIGGNRLFYSSQLRYELDNHSSLRKLLFCSDVFTRPRPTQTSLGTRI